MQTARARPSASRVAFTPNTTPAAPSIHPATASSVHTAKGPQPAPAPTYIDVVHATAIHTHGRVFWTHKAHEIERERFTRKAGLLSIFNIGVAALTTGFAVASPFIQHPRGFILTAIFAAANVCLVIAQASLNYPEKEAQQRVAAKEILCLRDEIELLIMNCQMSDADPMVLRNSLEHFTRELDRAYKFVPNTSPCANGETGKRIHAGEMNFTEQEKESFLPASLNTPPSAKLTPADNAAAQLPRSSGQG